MLWGKKAKATSSLKMLERIYDDATDCFHLSKKDAYNHMRSIKNLSKCKIFESAGLNHLLQIPKNVDEKRLPFPRLTESTV